MTSLKLRRWSFSVSSERDESDKNLYHSCLTDLFCLFFLMRFERTSLLTASPLGSSIPTQNATTRGRLVRFRPRRVVGCRNLCIVRCSRWSHRCPVRLDRCCCFSYWRSSCMYEHPHMCTTLQNVLTFFSFSIILFKPGIPAIS